MSSDLQNLDFATAAFDLDAAAEAFVPFIERLNGLIKLMDANDGFFCNKFPPEFHISYDELYTVHHAGERTFFRYLPIYPQLKGEWICAIRQQIAMTFTKGLREVFAEKYLVLKKCAAIAGAKAGLPAMKEAKVSHNYFGEVHVGDRYSANQAGAMGPGAHAHDMVFTQTQQTAADKLDLTALAAELSKLREQLRAAAVEPDHDIALGQVAAAEAAARAGERGKVLDHLRGAGNWALDVATKIGVNLASEAFNTNPR